MTRITAILIISLFLNSGCSNAPDYSFLEGHWYLLAMTHKGQNLYPDNPVETVKMGIWYPGYEQYETINFQSSDSSLILPGFDCYNTKFNYSIQSQRLLIYSNSELILAQNVNQNTIDIYSGVYTINPVESNHYIELISDSTTIYAVNVGFVAENRLNEMFNF